MARGMTMIMSTALEAVRAAVEECVEAWDLGAASAQARSGWAWDRVDPSVVVRG